MNNKKVAPQIVGQVDFLAGNQKSLNVLFYSSDWARSAQKGKLHHWCMYTRFIAFVIC